MADYLTVYENKGKLDNSLRWFMLETEQCCSFFDVCRARLGVNVTVVCPRGFEPNLNVFRNATEDAKITGAKIEVTNNIAEGVKGADAVYTDVWASMGQEAEAAERRKIFMPYQVNSNLMSYANSDALFMHCLPAHRGDEVTDEVIDAPNSVVFPEAENRLHAQKAVMYKLMK